MDGPAGESLTQETIDEAVACRLATARVHQEFAADELFEQRSLRGARAVADEHGRRRRFATCVDRRRNDCRKRWRDVEVRVKAHVVLLTSLAA